MAFASLHAAMVKKQCMALVRYSRNPRSPRLAVLIPQEEEIDDDGSQLVPPGLQLVTLPYLDNLRDVPVPPPVHVTDTTMDLARTLVRNISPEESFDSSSISNPALQKHYALVEAHALSDPVCRWNEGEDDETQPDVGIQQTWGETISDLAASCISPDDDSGGSKKRGGTSASGSSSKKVKTEAPSTMTPETIQDALKQGDLLGYTVPKLKEVRVPPFFKAMEIVILTGCVCLI